jgi:FMN-dependent NADH-azoreductase
VASLNSEEKHMKSILVLNSSVLGDQSVSRVLVEEAVHRLLEGNPRATVVQRDLGTTPIPHLTTATVAGVRGVPTTAEEFATRALSDELIAELQAADTLMIGAPMYNFSIPTGLRAWFDHVLRPGKTFSYTEAGPLGLITGKRVIIIESRGGHYSDGPAHAMDFQEPYLKALFRFIGLTHVTFIRAEKLGFGPAAREAAVAAAKQTLAEAA